MNTATAADHIGAVILDVDGVLTDGRIGYGSGPDEIKFFDVRDGLGIRLLQNAGVRVCLLSGRASPANRRRAEELRLDAVVEGATDKTAGLQGLLERLGLSAAACCYVGDDLIDIPVLRRVGLAVAVADAAEEVRAVAHWVTAAPGGRGAVREVAERLLKARGVWSEVCRRYEC
ncbi:MAG: HAD-IIIA family hydrolase [Lentisphaerae bacterium]|nr:HAD-IIIA family hydrolase [Lentisphaerota bacterium]